MSIISKYKHEILLFLLCLFVFTLRFDALFLPFFWDEMEVYSRGIHYLLDNGISMMPGSIAPELSRGHPMLFIFFAAIFMKLFGTSVFVGHLFAFIVSITTLVAIYFTFQKILDSKMAALTIVLFMAFQPMFLAQSTLMLPEMMLTLFSVLAFYSYFFNEKKSYFIYASLAILTKETAVFIPISFFVSEILLSYLNKEKSSKYWILLPLLTFGIFLIVQKIQNGWFLFPYHVSLLNFQIESVVNIFVRSCYFLFVSQGKLLLLLSFITLCFVYKSKMKNFYLKHKKIYLLSLIFIFIIISFQSLFEVNMNRYFMFILPFSIAILIAPLIHFFEERKLFGSILISSCCLVQLFFLSNKNKFNYDVDLGYEYYVKSLTDAFEYTNQNISKNSSFYGNFHAIFPMQDNRTGYNAYPFKISKNATEADYLLISNFWQDDEFLDKSTPLFEVEKEFNCNFAKVVLYKKKRD